MAKDNAKFRHDSLQSRKTVGALLSALQKGVAKGELRLSDDDGDMVLHPDGMLTLRVMADRNDGQCRVDLRITWNDDPDRKPGKDAPKIG